MLFGPSPTFSSGMLSSFWSDAEWRSRSARSQANTSQRIASSMCARDVTQAPQMLNGITYQLANQGSPRIEPSLLHDLQVQKSTHGASVATSSGRTSCRFLHKQQHSIQRAAVRSTMQLPNQALSFSDPLFRSHTEEEPDIPRHPTPVAVQRLVLASFEEEFTRGHHCRPQVVRILLSGTAQRRPQALGIPSPIDAVWQESTKHGQPIASEATNGQLAASSFQSYSAEIATCLFANL